MRGLAAAADIPMQVTIVRDEPVHALAHACASCGPWNVVALAEPLSPGDGAMLSRLFLEVPGTTGLVVVGPTAKRNSGRIVGVVEDIEHFDAVLRTTRRIFDVSGESRFTLLLVNRRPLRRHGRSRGWQLPRPGRRARMPAVPDPMSGAVHLVDDAVPRHDGGSGPLVRSKTGCR
jgi:hypothetical protein